MENDFLPMDLNTRRFIFESVRFMCRWAVIAWPLITYQTIKQECRVNYSSEQIKDAAVRAVDAIVRDIRSYPNGIVSNEELLLIAGLRPPPDG